MADNTAQNGTSTISTDEIATLNGVGQAAGLQMQRVKPAFGADGVAVDVSSTNPLPVIDASNAVVSTTNSSATPLIAAAAFTGVAEDVSGYATIMVSVFADKASFTDGLQLQQSSNGTNWDFVDSFTIPANTGRVFSIGVQARYFRVVFTNSIALDQTVFRLQTLYSKYHKKSSSVRPQDARPNDNDFEEMLSYGMAYDPSTNAWSRMVMKPANVGSTQADPALVVAIRPTPRNTYTAVMARVATGALTANTLKAVFTIEHSASATKTLRLRQLLISGFATTAVAGTVEFQLARGTAATAGGTTITPNHVVPTGTASEAATVIRSLPTTAVAATVMAAVSLNPVPATANSSFGPTVDLMLNQDQVETQPFTLSAGALQSLVLNIISTGAINATLNITAVFTEE